MLTFGNDKLSILKEYKICLILSNPLLNLELLYPAKLNKFLVTSEGIMPSPLFKTLNSGPFSPTKCKPAEAFEVYKKAKESYIKEVADFYMSKYPNFPKKIYDALYNYKVDIND